MSRYIDADELRKETEKKIREANSYRMAVVDGEFLDLIDDAPTEDVVEVVRCKDCKHWKDQSLAIVMEEHWGNCRKPLGDYRYCETAENDFCSYGERREE